MIKLFKIFLFFVLLFNISNCLKKFKNDNILSEPTPSDENVITIEIKEKENYKYQQVGAKGTIYFNTNYNDKEKKIFDPLIIEKNTSFPAIVENDKGDTLNTTCRLWKNIDENVFLFCKFEEDIPQGRQNITIDNDTVTYGDYKIKIAFEKNNFNIYFYDSSLPFIYSSEQTIEIDDANDTYELTFKFDVYNNETLLLHHDYFIDIPLTDFSIQGNELKCQINKDKILENLEDNNQVFTLAFLSDIFGGITVPFSNKVKFSYNAKKEDIYVQITKLLETDGDIDSFIAYETNITNISNIFGEFSPELFGLNESQSQCILKKSETTPLLLLCTFDEEKTYSLGEIENEMRFDKINIKYNFIFVPVTNNDNFTIGGKGSIIEFAYPNILDYNLNDTISIDFFIGKSNNVNGIKLNPDSDELKCVNVHTCIKRCYVPRSHFENTKSGEYHYIYHLNYLNKYVRFYEVSPIKVILPDDNEIILRIKEEDNNNKRIIGEKGIIAFNTNYNDNKLNIFNIADIEEKTSFITEIIDNENNKFNVSCRLWEPTNEKLKIFCELNDTLKQNINTIKLTKTTFLYNDKYNITILPEIESINVQVVQGIFPFLYADHQEINVLNNKDSYDIKLKIGNYNNELLELYDRDFNEKLFDDCKINGKELTCTITKTEIEEILAYDGEIFHLGVTYEKYGYSDLDYIFGIKINYKDVTKEDIYIDIKEFKEDKILWNRFIVYETNVTSIKTLSSGRFTLDFNNSPENYCIFQKKPQTNLLLLCLFMNNTGQFFLKETNTNIIKDDVSILYTFIITPITNNETFEVREEKSLYIFNNYPKILDYSEKDTINIYLPFLNKYYPNNRYKLNPEGDYLDCQILESLLLCNVPSSHFTNSSIEYYNLYYNTSEKTFSIVYELTPFKVIFNLKTIEIAIEDNDNKDLIKIGQNGIIYLITNYNDSENIFIESELEGFNFEVSFTDGKANEDYKSSCNLWKPEKENLRIICQLKNNLPKGETNIYLQKDLNIVYKNKYNLNITANTNGIKVKQLEESISFLYYKNQQLEIKDETQYILTFKYKSYDEQPLYLYQNNMKSLRLNECKKEGKDEIKCNINKNELLSILSYDGEIYSLAQRIENEGIYIFNSVLDIKLIYKINQEEIKINKLELLTPSIAKNEFIVYKTDINQISELITDFFTIETNNTENLTCLFKKNEKMNLLLLCNAAIEGEDSLGELSQKTFDKISVLYKFILEESAENDDIFNITNDEGAKISNVYPTELNFSKKDWYIVTYETESPDKLKGIKLNPDSSSELECKDKAGYKECNVTKDHITKKDYYHTYHKNYLGETKIYYEVPLIYAIPKDKNSGNSDDEGSDNLGAIIGGSVAGVIVLLIIIFLIIHYMRKRGGDSSAIEEEAGKLISVNLSPGEAELD